MILLSSLLSACVTAFAGPISFVGIAVPHLVRMATKTARPIILIPGCFLCGAVVTLFCDGIARTVFAPTEISISSVTALFLVPGVAFDKDRHRCGYGKGFYDRYLSRHTQHATVAMALDFQIVETVPSDVYDICPQMLITPTMIYGK